MWQIAAATGWSVRHILWEVNYQTLLVMMADAPRYRSKAKNEEHGARSERTDEEEAAEIAGFFSSL